MISEYNYFIITYVLLENLSKILTSESKVDFDALTEEFVITDSW